MNFPPRHKSAVRIICRSLSDAVPSGEPIERRAMQDQLRLTTEIQRREYNATEVQRQPWSSVWLGLTIVYILYDGSARFH